MCKYCDIKNYEKNFYGSLSKNLDNGSYTHLEIKYFNNKYFLCAYGDDCVNKEIKLEKYLHYIWDIKTEEPHSSYSFQSQMFKLVKPKKTSKQKPVENSPVKKCKFKVGDKVRIRTWDNMAKEFGITAMGSINVPFSFTKQMNEELSGKVFTIKDIKDDCYHESVEGKFTEIPVYRIIFEEPCNCWNISEQMCEKANSKSTKTEQKIVKDSPFFTEEEQVKILNALEVIISKIKGE